MLVPFLTQAERVQSEGSVHRQHALQMVDFMLKELRHVALQLACMSFPSQVLVADAYMMGSLQSDHQVGKREAIIPHGKIVGPDIGDFRIDQDPGAVNLDIDNAHGRANLRRGDCPTHPMTSFQVPKRFFEVIHYDSYGG